MRDYRTLHYWIDDMGYLWKGPVAPESTMHYARLEGVQVDDTPCWVIRRSAEPEDVMEIPREWAHRIVARYVSELGQKT